MQAMLAFRGENSA